jgi:hypothetical protein
VLAVLLLQLGGVVTAFHRVSSTNRCKGIRADTVWRSRWVQEDQRTCRAREEDDANDPEGPSPVRWVSSAAKLQALFNLTYDRDQRHISFKSRRKIRSTQMAPHDDSMVEGIERKRLRRVRMVDLSISGKKGLPAVGILIGATEQCLREIKQSVSSPGIAKVDQARESQAPVPAMLGQHVSLLQVVVAKDRSSAVLQKVEARLHILFQSVGQGLPAALLAKLSKRVVERANPTGSSVPSRSLIIARTCASSRSTVRRAMAEPYRQKIASTANFHTWPMAANLCIAASRQQSEVHRPSDQCIRHGTRRQGDEHANDSNHGIYRDPLRWRDSDNE